MSRRPARFIETDHCSFCGRDESDGGPIIRGPKVQICEHCVEIIVEIFNSRYETQGKPPLVLDPRPAAILQDVAVTPVTWEQPGFVYFLHAQLSNRIKIGFSLNPAKRYATIQTSCPEQLILMGTVPAAYRDEMALHQKFASIRIHREWFEAVPELLSYIKEVAK
jgi:hypothetical protein